ncbi:TolC family protein [Sorangium sp. So ce128]|uniref:TolC family protein n=1 Tax=Sorangium sp. So ce128 TaxID=3133281 RepID=UPI003F620485
MRTERRRSRALASRLLPLVAGLALSSAAAAGCAAPSSTADMARIRELSRVELPKGAASEEVDPAPADGARALGQAPRQPLTADAAVRIALLNNRELRAVLKEVGVARGNLEQAGKLPNPEIAIGVTPLQEGVEHAHLELEVEIDLTSALLSPLHAKAARSEHEAARYRAAGAVVDLGYQVRAAFYAAQAAEQRLGIANRALDAFAAARDAARALFEAGNVPELDVATQEAGYEEARVTAAQMELELLSQRERLTRLLGLSGAATSWTIAGAVPAAPEALATPPRAESLALRASLELAELRSRLEAAAGRAGALRAEGWVPDVAIGVHGERELGASGEAHEHPWVLGAGVRLSLPLFDRRQGAEAAQAAEFDGLLERYHGRAVDVRSAVREAQSRLLFAHARARHYARVILPARKRVLEQTLLQYNAMQVGVFQLLSARREQLDAELAAVEALREHWTAKAAFDALLAGRRVEAAGAGAPAAMPRASATGEGGH